MNTRSFAAGLCLIGFATGGVWAQPSRVLGLPTIADQGLTCAVFQGTQDQHERRALRLAPEGAKRISDHVLAVTTKAGVHRFVDKKPYRDELSGFHWSYCGYLPKLRAHLIGVEDEDLFTGKLLLDRDGRVLEGGQTVYPSPNGKLFLAAEQRDGDELEQWVLWDLSGRRLWAGDSGVSKIESKIEIVGVAFEAPRWVSDDAIVVTATCADRGRAKGQASLVRAGKSWRWKSDLRCND